VNFGDFDWRNIEFPHFVGAVTDDELFTRAVAISHRNPIGRTQVKDRAVAEGDFVNIDFVGYIDGVPFDGGSTAHREGGYDVTAGGDDFIDGFLDQIIGHMPGATIEVNVTFPEHYPQNDTLEGKDAMFVTTINFIIEEEDEDVYAARVFGETFGWTTFDAFREGLRLIMIREEHDAHLDELFADIEVEIPEELLHIAVANLIRFHQGVAESGSEEDDVPPQPNFAAYLDHLGIEGGIRGVAARGRPLLESRLRSQLIFQAIAEEMEISVEFDNVREYYNAWGGRHLDVNDEAERSGIGFLKQETLGWMIRGLIIEEATRVGPPPMAD
jgi:trigger factor